jgi:ABC-type spermidine/putrescine transport system permease subunit I
VSWARWTPAILLAPAGVAFLTLFALPVGWLLVTSLAGPRWTIAHYVRFAGDSYYLATLGTTVLLGGLVAIGTTLLGMPLAWWLARLPERWGRPLLIFLTVPLWTNAVVRSFAWIVVLGRHGIVTRALAILGVAPPRLLQTLPAVVVALTQVLLPISVLALYGVVRRIDPRMEAAARTLGASRLRAALAVTLPLAGPAIVSMALLSFVLAAGAFVTPSLVGGPRVHLMSGTIYDEMVTLADWPFAATLAILLLGTVLAIVVVQQRFAPRT